MEFLAGVVATLLVEFVGYKIYQKRKERENRLPQATRRPGPTDYPANRKEP